MRRHRGNLAISGFVCSLDECSEIQRRHHKKGINDRFLIPETSNAESALLDLLAVVAEKKS